MKNYEEDFYKNGYGDGGGSCYSNASGLCVCQGGDSITGKGDGSGAASGYGYIDGYSRTDGSYSNDGFYHWDITGFRSGAEDGTGCPYGNSNGYGSVDGFIDDQLGSLLMSRGG